MPSLSDFTKTLTPAEVGFVYLAGPYRGKDALAHDHTVFCEIDAHINEARRWAARLAADSVPYFCPHLNSAHMEVIAPTVPSNYWLEMDLAILVEAKALMLLPGWRDSSGARAEKGAAMALDPPIPVYTHQLYAQFLDDWWARLGRLVLDKQKEKYDG